MKQAKVYIIGAGPGDPELLTIKAKRILESADVVLYDYLAHPNIVMLAEDSIKVCVGKKKGANSMKQDAIHELLLQYAETHRVIVRLKGGDPMVFGRCGEEMNVLKDNNIPYEIIPGITSAIAAPTYAGIPITHRDYSHSVAFVTATRANDIQNMIIPTADTLILMMSLLRIDPLIERLCELKDKKTPIAIIESGTLSAQKQLVGTLGTIRSQQLEAQLKPPALMVVGDVAKLGEQFEWRSHLPLRNRRFVLFRSTTQQSPFRNLLFSAGAEVLSLPLNQIKTNPEAFVNKDISAYSHIIFTSENGVRSFFECLQNTPFDTRALMGKTIVAIGNHTQDTLQSFGLNADIIPSPMNSIGLINELKGRLSKKDRLLIPTSSMASTVIPSELSQTGATVDQVSVFNNTPTDAMEIGSHWLKPNDELVFMNGVSVDRFCEHYDNLNMHRLYSIGPQTSARLRDYGAENIIESPEPSIDHLFEKIIHTSG